VYTLAYIDDIILVCHPTHFASIWPLWKQALAESGLEVQQAKCHSWVPQTPQILPQVNNVVEQVPPEQHGLPLLGSAAQGAFETFLSVYSVGIQPKIKRSDKAAKLSQLIKQMQESLSAPKKQAAWPLLLRVLAVRLDYDCRISDPMALIPLAA
jgi:hypothetical protein